METNEIEKNTITAQNAENAQKNENIQPSAEKAEIINTENTESSAEKVEELKVVPETLEEHINTQPIVVKKQKNDDIIDMQATQRIDFLSDLINDTQVSQQENFEAKKAIDAAKAENNYLSEKSSDENKDINKYEKQNEDVKLVNEEANKTTDNTSNIKAEENKNNIVSNENSESNEKKHSQDKKDYRLEKLLLDRINAMQGKIKESLELIKKFERINAKEENLPNIVTTLRDKLTQEVIKQFRTVGLEFNMKSYLVQAVVSDLLEIFEDGITEFKECSENLNFVREVQADFESRIELAPTSKVKNMFARLRGLFKPEKMQERLMDLERERQEKKLEEANIHLIKYKYKNSELDKYTIRKNIVQSLTREILNGKGSGEVLSVDNFINQNIAPEMEQLGLQYLIDPLKENLYKEYKEKCKIESKEEFMNMNVSDVKKTIKTSAYESARAKIVMTTNANVIEDEEDRMAI